MSSWVALLPLVLAGWVAPMAFWPATAATGSPSTPDAQPGLEEATPARASTAARAARPRWLGHWGGVHEVALDLTFPPVVSAPSPSSLRFDAKADAEGEGGVDLLAPLRPGTLFRGPYGSGLAGGTLSYYPAEGVRTVDGLRLTQQQAFLYGVRRFELGRGQAALRGADVLGSVGLFAGAMATSFGWLSESQALWLAGGAAALGAAYGASVGYESGAWREEWRWPAPRNEGAGIHIRVRPAERDGER